MRTRTRDPITLPVVRIQVDETGAAAVTVNDTPYATPTGLGRGDVRQLVQNLADQVGPIRVELIEANGETYVDIETHRDEQPTQDTERSPDPQPTFDRRFAPGEGVVVAVVVGRSTADIEGAVRLTLPPGILLRHDHDVVLVGETSHTVVAATDLGQGGEPA